METTVALIAVMLSAVAANNALAERDSRQHARALAEEATAQHDKAKKAEKRVMKVSGEPGLKLNSSRPCIIKPVMSDGEMNECRVQYRYETPVRRDQ